MKGKITIYANTINKTRADIGLEMNINHVSTRDKFLLVQSLMQALDFTPKDKRAFCAGVLFDLPMAKHVEDVTLDLHAPEVDAYREAWAQALAED